MYPVGSDMEPLQDVIYFMDHPAVAAQVKIRPVWLGMRPDIISHAPMVVSLVVPGGTENIPVRFVGIMLIGFITVSYAMYEPVVQSIVTPDVTVERCDTSTAGNEYQSGT